MHLGAEPAFLVRARRLFDGRKQGADDAFGLRMMPLEFIALEFLLASVFQSLVRVFVGNNAIKQFDSFNGQGFHFALRLKSRAQAHRGTAAPSYSLAH